MKQLENRLLKSSLINNYGVSTNILSTIERRDLVLDNLVNDADNDIEEHVDVYIEHRRGVFYSYRYNLKDGSFIVTPFGDFFQTTQRDGYGAVIQQGSVPESFNSFFSELKYVFKLNR